MRSLSILACLCACACAANRSNVPIGSTLDAPLPSEPPPKAAPPPPVPDDVVARAAQTFHGRRSADGSTLEARQLLDELSHFDVICLGEAHDAARDHYAELMVVQGLQRRAEISGRALGVGLEMFQTPANPALQNYGNGRLTDAGLRKKTKYDERWGFPFAYYQPVLAFARENGLPLYGLNATRDLTHAVSERGLAGLNKQERAQLPDLDLDDAVHRQTFEYLMEGHPRGPGMNLDNFYAAQVVWDETMASNAARWVDAHAPTRQLLVLAGNAHCRQEAIPSRIMRRVRERVTNVRLGASQPSDAEGYAYTLVFDER